MARVTILTHDEFLHRKSGVRFKAARVRNADGHAVWLGVATVDDAVAAEHFTNHTLFRVEGLTVEAPAAHPPVTNGLPAPTTDTNRQSGAGAPPTGEPVESLKYAALTALAKERLPDFKPNTPKPDLVAALVAAGVTHAPAKAE